MSREVVTETVIKALREFKVPWRGDYGFPRNIISGKRYSGVNPLLLNLGAEKHGWKSPYWGTYGQWVSQGYRPRPRPENLQIGDWTVQIVLYKREFGGIMSVTGFTHGANVLRHELSYWSAFNLDQIDGGFGKLRLPAVIEYDVAQQVVEATHAAIDFKYRREAEYHYGTDKIFLPLKEQFVNGPGGLPAYYHTVFHELIHWSEPRMGWRNSPAVNELRAEIGADYLCTELNLPRLDMSKRQNHQAHIDEWSALMQQDPDLIFRISAEAERSVDFILSFGGATESRHNPPGEVP